ncbi:mitochondrial metallochaperone Sco1 [Dendryphion nanum]|uniref:Mitochondrial metallochaperone Sco1 n=1 Tax=Dendryphion nanum TaxID=256645 RepID=A0A9P9DU73_9PLEO|nr:mitochondrial metallochaperone Sco1 [Dendryphion nanum]
MFTQCNCLTGAAKSLHHIATLQTALRTSARRTFVKSHHSYTTDSICRTTTQKSSCVRQMQENSPKKQHALRLSTRHFSGSAARPALKTMEQIKARQKSGPFNITAAILFVGTAGGMWAYFTYEKERMARKRIAEQTKGMGKPKVGGPFDLVDQDGNRFTHKDMEGRYTLVYFGFTHCPDICPDELDKMALMYDKTVEKCGNVLLPLMITCDPARDTPAVLKEYLKEFHPAIVGLTGDYDSIKQTCKEYRVYFSTPPTVKEGQDYLVDHSIYFYLMDPEGDFVEAIGRNFTADQAAKVISDHIKDWDKPLKKEQRWE